MGEPKRWCSSQKTPQKPPESGGSPLPKCAHSLKTQDQGDQPRTAQALGPACREAALVLPLAMFTLSRGREEGGESDLFGGSAT